MSPSVLNPDTIFAQAIEIQSAEERAAYLADACGKDAELHREVEKLVKDHFRAGNFLEEPAAGAGMTLDAPAGERPGAMIGPYKLMEEIGAGGFGLVFVAEQQQPVRRKVALKVIKPGMDTREVIARFEAERQALALMDHPNIARVFEGGTTPSGRPYFVMELVRGVPITDFCDQSQFSVRQRLDLFINVCQAVQHAHQKGTIHRDLKPSNIMVTMHDAKPVVKVIDFGVAKAVGQQLTEKTIYTRFTQMIGTPQYMSPEQAGMSGLDIDTRTDIYALGVLLYELLTGTTPFEKERLQTATYEEIRRIIREEEPPKPSTRFSTLGQAACTVSANRNSDPIRLSQLIRGELDWIVMRALDKDRNRRYESASAFAADVERYLQDEPVLACPPSAWYRFRKFARRNKAALATASVVALVVLVTAAVSGALIWQANQNLQHALKREQYETYIQRITVAHRELSIDNLSAALRALQDCPERLRGWEWHYLMRLLNVEPLVLRDSTEVYGVAWSPVAERIASVGKDGNVKIWDIQTRRVIQQFPAHLKAARSVAFHPKGRHVASAGADGLVKVWDLATEQAVFQGECDAIRPFGAAYTVAFRPPDGRYLAAGYDEAVRTWDWEDRRLLCTLSGPEHHSIPVAFSGDGRHMATGGPGGLNLWDVETWRLLRTLPTRPHPASALAFSPDCGRLASGSLGRIVSLWDTTTGKTLQTIHHTGNVLAVAFSPPDGRRLVSAGEDKTVHVWDATRPDEKQEPREVLALHGHTDMCGCVAFSPDGWRLVSASHDGTIRVWDATPLRADEGQGILTFPQHHEVRTVAVSPDGRSVVSAGNGTHSKVWEAAAGRETFRFAGHSATVFSVAWHPDGGRIATAGSVGRQHSVKVWEASDGHEHFKIPAGRGAGPYQVVAFSPDGLHLVTGQLEGAVQVWDATTGEKVQVRDATTGQTFDTFATHEREIRGLAFSRDGRLLATASGDGQVMLWDATRLGQKQKPRRILQARVPGPSVNVAFSPDGRRLATGGEENTIKIWDVETGAELLKPLRGHSKEVYAVAFSPDDEGRWVASGGEDGKVKIWDSRSGKLVRTFHGHTGLVSSLAFSPDGKRLYSGSRDTTVKVWDLTQLDKE